MKKMFRKYRHTTSLLAVVVLMAALAALHVLPLAAGIVLLAIYQLIQLAISKPKRRYCYNTTGFTPEQIREFEGIVTELKTLGQHIPGLKSLSEADGGFAAIKKLPEIFKTEAKRVDEIQADVKKLRKLLSTSQGSGAVRWAGNVPFVTDDCARACASIFILETKKLGDSAMRQLNREERTWEGLVSRAYEFLGIEQKAGGALTPTDIPLPTIYVPQIIELVFAYGQARQYGTVFPLGAGTVKLPRLQAGEDDFGFLGAGTAGMSTNIPEKEVTAQLVTFTANKFGGLIRIPTELEEDTFVPLGQFLARYISRQLAKGEDKTMFLADGTGTYANITGVGPYCAANPAYLRQLGAGKVKPTDATLNDFRALRGLVNPAVLANMAANGQTSAAYYMHPTMESLLVTFNTLGTPQVYVPATNGQPAKLDGFPIRWIGVSQANNQVAAPNSFLTFFGDLSYWYLGERGAVRVEVSKEVFFQTDELAMRALERIDVEAMAIDAMATLQTAAQ